MTRLLARIRCAISASHDTETVGNVTTCRRGCGFRWARPRGNRPMITPAQRQVLAAYALLGSQREASRVLGISRHTYRTHTESASRTLGAHSLVEVFDLLGWLVVPDEDIARVVAAVAAAGEAERRAS